MRYLPLIVLPLFLSFASVAEETPPPMPLDKQEQVEGLHNAIGILNIMKADIEQVAMEKKNQCMKAIGDTQFCDCIAEKSPSGITFTEYVAILVSTKDDLKYDELSPEDKKMVDNARKSRDQCVNWNGKEAH
jgi:hypothetical protein